MKSAYDSQSVEEFEISWDKLITTYNLHENAWLQSLYAEREQWVPAFLKDYFKMITLAAGSREYTQDAKAKLYGMINLYLKAKEKKAQEKGKRKEQDGGDAPILNTQRSLFGHSEMDIANAGHVQAVPKSAAFHISGTQI
ncbi:hypothetical protein Q3G72_024653 [Acer saccharum]|nr:hypothetical protein Q3G72_024653 [Acer saccharum]